MGLGWVWEVHGAQRAHGDSELRFKNCGNNAPSEPLVNSDTERHNFYTWCLEWPEAHETSVGIRHQRPPKQAVRGSSPTRPTEVGHPTRPVTCRDVGS